MPMTSPTPATSLAVPIECAALVVNQAVVASDTFRWWQYDYDSLDDFLSPEPAAFDGMLTSPPATGVYLTWKLPAALRVGTQNSKTGAIDYPLVPNRWLVLRVRGGSRREATGWVIESDCPFTSGDVTQSSLYLADPSILALWSNSKDPHRNGFSPEDGSQPNIGVPFDLSSWQERAPDAMFLTAVAPANPVFSGYMPHNRGVFSFHDDLAGIAAEDLSYYVVGWTSDPTRDIANSSTDRSDLLKRLNWTLGDGGGDFDGPGYYFGSCFEVAWDPGTTRPANDPLQAIRDGGGLNVAVGNTTIDAFTALVTQQIGDTAAPELLRAFNYDLLPVLDQVNGDALLRARIHREWFGASAGGHAWTIVERKSEGDVEVALSTAEAQWLEQLNSDQAALNGAIGTLYSLQWELNALWYKAQWLNIPDNTPLGPPDDAPTPQAIDQAIDPGQPGSIAARLVQQLAAVKALLQKVPQPNWSGTDNQQTAFEAGILAFADARKLDASKVLKAVAAPRYWRANNPVVVISGVSSPYGGDPDKARPVRTIERVITTFVADGRQSTASTVASQIIQLPGMSALPGGVAPLVGELFLLDPASVAALAAATGLTEAQVEDAMRTPATAYRSDRPDQPADLPALSLAPWSQPWTPLFVEWRGDYQSIPEPDSGGGNWRFDGSDYNYTGAPVDTPRQRVGGISLLSPHAPFLFGTRLKRFIASDAKETELADIWQEIDKVYDWKFLAQELVGFNQALALRDLRPFRRPQSSDTIGSGSNQCSLGALLGYDLQSDSDALPQAYRGTVETMPLIPNGDALPFNGLRQGQFNFTDLMLYDQFGRVLWLISSTDSSGLYDADNFPAVIEPSLVPRHSLRPQVRAMTELPPRALQGARLDVDLLDQFDDTKVLDVDGDVCPVCGWLLPNHLDNGLLLFAADGTSLGEVRLTVGLDGISRSATWMPPPHGSATSLTDVDRLAPHLGALIRSTAFGSESGFTAFLSAIDATLWTVDPLGSRPDQSLSVLVGRPLALVRSRLALKLEGLPIRDTGWAATLTTATPDYVRQTFAVRLGDQATREDGTIGYYVDQDYSTFNSVAAPTTGAGQTYVCQIGPLGRQGGQNYLQLSFDDQVHVDLTLLVDPRASVHATTGIVPVKRIVVPPRFVDPALSRMEIGFRLGPVLTSVQASPGSSDHAPTFPTAIAYPTPAERNGVWSWWEAEVNKPWTGRDLVAATPNARIGVTTNSLRDGILQLAIDMEKQLES